MHLVKCFDCLEVVLVGLLEEKDFMGVAGEFPDLVVIVGVLF